MSHFLTCRVCGGSILALLAAALFLAWRSLP
jgi:hypothetical protein